MNTKRDYYEILSIEKTATVDEVKKSYRKLAVQFHPDRNPGDRAAEEKFKEINEAYQILSDPKKRSIYDQFGHAGLGGQGSGFEGGFSGSFTDIFDGIFSDIFGGQGARSGGGAGVDLRYNLEIGFEEAVFGTEKSITFEKETVCEACQGSGARSGTQPKPCTTCRGSGQVRFNQGFFTLTRTCSACAGRGSVIEDRCRTCRGSGRAKKPVTINVTVPAGIASEQRLRLRGEGEIAEPNGNPGDLYVIIRVKEHPFFTREDEHIILELPITFTQAALGARVEIPGLNNQRQALDIPAGIQSGGIVRIRGGGIRRLGETGKGDMLVRISIETPCKLTAKQRTILEQFEQEADTYKAHPLTSQFRQRLDKFFTK